MQYRHDWDIVRPWVHLAESELADLKSGPFVAGFTDASVDGREDLYDVFVNGKKELRFCSHPFFL